MKSIPKKYILFGLMDLRGVGLGEQICQKEMYTCCVHKRNQVYGRCIENHTL